MGSFGLVDTLQQMTLMKGEDGGYDRISSHLNEKQFTPQSFHAHLYFPCSSNQGGDFRIIDNFAEAKKYCEEMFIDFKKHIK